MLRYLAKNIGKCLRDTHKQQQLVLAQGQYTTNSFIQPMGYCNIMHVMHGLYCHMYLKYHFYLQGNTTFMSFMHKQATDDLLSVFFTMTYINFFKIQCIFIHKSCIPILTYVYPFVFKVLILPIGKYNFQVFGLYIYTNMLLLLYGETF